MLGIGVLSVAWVMILCCSRLPASSKYCIHQLAAGCWRIPYLIRQRAHVQPVDLDHTGQQFCRGRDRVAGRAGDLDLLGRLEFAGSGSPLHRHGSPRRRRRIPDTRMRKTRLRVVQGRLRAGTAGNCPLIPIACTGPGDDYSAAGRKGTGKVCGSVFGGGVWLGSEDGVITIWPAPGLPCWFEVP